MNEFIHYITFPEHSEVPKTFSSWCNIYTDTTCKKELTRKQNTVCWQETENSRKNKYEKYKLINIDNKIKELEMLIERTPNDLQGYTTFTIPKKSGGTREINAPEPNLKLIQKAINELLNKYWLPHNAAHAYIEHRGTLTALQEHQKNNSTHFLKLDIKDFFPNSSKEFVIKTLHTVYPFSLIKNFDILENILNYAFLNNGLPQGSPCSPTITNIIMVPIDYIITKMLNKINNNFVYTRYADDMLISLPDNFDFINIQNKINYILQQNTPYQIKKEKTRYGTNSGANWNLGLMLNKENNITIGHKTKEFFRAKTFNIIKKLINNTITPQDKYKYLGIVSYYSMIEKKYPFKIISRIANKFNISGYEILDGLKKS